ncbi:hypothetical protein [Flammeovirga agarivorans]|uniref:Uncharacterized protein n=1 Tax=Flammeovirga agarivorans TaxID=2726742 RepID=A0A7X8SQ98_9BACT|nr:hypothetical protein [Flammeovirga agarivorans]NLR94407.1 hypothetical protein [Flammeovirga agarivorans]
MKPNRKNYKQLLVFLVLFIIIDIIQAKLRVEGRPTNFLMTANYLAAIAGIGLVSRLMIPKKYVPLIMSISFFFFLFGYIFGILNNIDEGIIQWVIISSVFLLGVMIYMFPKGHYYLVIIGLFFASFVNSYSLGTIQYHYSTIYLFTVHMLLLSIILFSVGWIGGKLLEERRLPTNPLKLTGASMFLLSLVTIVSFI